MAIYKNIFGHYYDVVLPGESSSLEVSAETSMEFNDDSSAQQFLRSLVVSPEELTRLAHKLERTSQEFRSDQDPILFLSRCLLKRRLKVVKTEISENLNESLAARSVKISGSKTVTFMLPAELQLQSKRISKSFASEREAAKYVQILNLNKEKEKAILVSLGSASDADSSKNTSRIASALVAGKLLAHESSPKVARLEPGESSVETDIPGSRPVQSPPTDDTKQSKEEESSNSNQEAQAETLKKAAENEAAFCENCDAA